MFHSVEVALQRYADALAAKGVDAVAGIQRAFWPKEDPKAAAWRETLEGIKCLASFLGREEIPIYFQLLPPLQPICLFSYYEGMHLEPRLLPSTFFRLGIVALVDYNLPSKPWIRHLTYILSATFLMFELFPSIMWPLLHSIIYNLLALRNICLQRNSSNF